MPGTHACMQWNTPIRFTSITRRQSCGGEALTGAVGPAMPALFTSTSTRPKRSRTVSCIARADSGRVTSRALILHQRARLEIGDRDPQAVVQQAASDGPAHTAGAAGDDRDVRFRGQARAYSMNLMSDSG